MLRTAILRISRSKNFDSNRCQGKYCNQVINFIYSCKKVPSFALQYLQQATMPKLKMKLVGFFIRYPTSFTPAIQVTDISGAGAEKIRPLSWSDPELECRIRDNEDFDLNSIMNARRATNTPRTFLQFKYQTLHKNIVLF